MLDERPQSRTYSHEVSDSRTNYLARTESPVDPVAWPPNRSLYPGTPAPLLTPTTWYLSFKVVLEYVLAVVLFVLSLPVILIAAVLVKLTSAGPIFYSQVRLGKNGRPFTLYKIRTMYHDCERTSGPCWSAAGDLRITRVGYWLRRTHLDELPQLWNVLRGEMSLVGPRPERPEFVPALEQAIPHYRDRLVIRPGVTGLAQVQLPADTDMASVRRKLAYDLYYIRHLNLWLDLRLMLCTGFRMLGLPFHLLGRLFFLPRREVVTSPSEAWQLEHTPVAGRPIVPCVQVSEAQAG